MGPCPGGPGNELEGSEKGTATMHGLNAADCQAAGARYEDLRSQADRFRSAGNLDADAPARSRGFAAARHGIGTLMARMGMRLRGRPEAGGTTAAPPAALRSAR